MFGIDKLKKDIQRLYADEPFKDKRVSDLYKRVKELESKEAEYKKQLEQLNWKLDNPCPYKVGEKLKNGDIITEVYVSWYNHSLFGNLFNKNTWLFKTVKPLK